MEPSYSGSGHGLSETRTLNSIDLRDPIELTRLARQARSASVSDQSVSKASKSVDKDASEDILDPGTSAFNLEAWLRWTCGTLKDDEIALSGTGVLCRNVRVEGRKSAASVQHTLGSILLAPVTLALNYRHEERSIARTILHDFDGFLRGGELLIVLGRPGSGCSTFLKALTGNMHGTRFAPGSESLIKYDGIPQSQMIDEFRGDILYNQDVDKHFPQLTVGQTLEHAAALRTPAHRPSTFAGSRQEFAKYITKIFLATYGLSHTYNTKVGDDYIRRVSGGERKRVSIAEMALARPALAAWDNSTKGLDAAMALTFVKSLRLSADLVGSSHVVAIHQASEAIYSQFDKAAVLYEGREVFYGSARDAGPYFERMGWKRHSRQTTSDFLTSVTSSAEREAREGCEKSVPRTASEFEAYWRRSLENDALRGDMTKTEQAWHYDKALRDQREYHRSYQQGPLTRAKSSYMLSFAMQVQLNLKRAFQRLWNNKTATFAPIISNVIMALVIGSVYFGEPPTTNSFQSKGAVVFFAILLNALTAITEVNGLYEQRPIVEKHTTYAFYHPSSEAIASLILDVPLKFMLAVAFNLTLYFMAGLRTEPAQFFLFFLINYTATFSMVAVFRTVAAGTKTVAQAMALAGVLVLAIVLYTGFVVPATYMRDWFGWIRWINPVFYAFEALIANEFHGREFACDSFFPKAPSNAPRDASFVCLSRGAIAGRTTVSGDRYIAAAYGYTYAHFWRNFGILLCFVFVFLSLYFIVVELNSKPPAAAEFLVFRKGHKPKYLEATSGDDHEASGSSSNASSEPIYEEANPSTVQQGAIVTWHNIDYTIQVKGQGKRLLDNISGFVEPGSLTALMGTSGAGKTTLLNVLAQRAKIGVVSGSIFANGASLGLSDSLQRRIGYVQQQDLHLNTATVRESLLFSANLRIPNLSDRDRRNHVDEIIQMLGMFDFAEAIVGEPGEGLNAEQRKLLSIGVELAAKPDLLVFLDEPTSGLDAQSAWNICAFLRKLAHQSGQAILCTIHQPSGPLFEQFDRLLFLRKGGQTVYFGDIGPRSCTILDYFERNGARKCRPEENPAEYILEAVEDTDEHRDWVRTWRQCPEARTVDEKIEALNSRAKPSNAKMNHSLPESEFAASFSQQLSVITCRLFQQYWRMPSYILAKMLLGGASGLFIGFTFYDANVTLQGMQNVLFSLFMVITIFITMVQQIMPLFVAHRALFEVREGPSKIYGWRVFLLGNFIVEIPYQILTGVIVFATFYFAVVGTGQSAEQQGLALFYCIVFFIYTSTFAHMVIAAIPDTQTASAIGSLFFGFSLIFNGILQPPSKLGWWIWMYHLSPLTYWVSGMSSTMLHNRPVQCAPDEISVFDTPSGQSCGAYLEDSLPASALTGYLQNPEATMQCECCPVRVADTFLAQNGIFWSQRWRDFGIMWAYVVFNVVMAVLLYYFFRFRSGKSKSRGKK